MTLDYARIRKSNEPKIAVGACDTLTKMANKGTSKAPSDISKILSAEGISEPPVCEIPENINDAMLDSSFRAVSGMEALETDAVASANLPKTGAPKKKVIISKKKANVAEVIYNDYKDNKAIGHELYLLMKLYDLTPLDCFFKSLRSEDKKEEELMLSFALTGIRLGVQIAESLTLKTQREDLNKLINSIRVEHQQLLDLKSSELARHAKLKEELDDQTRQMRQVMEQMETILIKSKANPQMPPVIVPKSQLAKSHQPPAGSQDPQGFMSLQFNEVEVTMDFTLSTPKMSFKNRKDTSKDLLKKLKDLLLTITYGEQKLWDKKHIILKDSCEEKRFMLLKSATGLTGYFLHDRPPSRA